LVREWGSAENPSDSRGKRPYRTWRTGNPCPGRIPRPCSRNPGDWGICHNATGGAMFQKPREMGHSGTWLQAARLPPRWRCVQPPPAPGSGLGRRERCHGCVQGKTSVPPQGSRRNDKAGQGKTPLPDVPGGNFGVRAYSGGNGAEFRRRELEKRRSWGRTGAIGAALGAKPVTAIAPSRASGGARASAHTPAGDVSVAGGKREQAAVYDAGYDSSPGLAR